ncbi:MAG: DHH family phosphoesterase [Candidatus Woesearchaeota archaeon]|nr:MAG: DHH family phosphoesterase [Candidatus Woesearchaeota archaeon]
MEKFIIAINEAVNKFNSLESKPIRIVCHGDSDGLTSAAMLVATLKRANKPFLLSVTKNLTDNYLKSLALENYDYYIFADLGSGQVDSVKKFLVDKTIFILDHHSTKDLEGIVHINPYLYGIDGDKEISGAGVTYLFCKTLNNENKDLAYLAVIGAIGETQEKKGFLGINNEILKDAIESRKLEVKTGLRMFGIQTRPLHKILQYSFDPYIPGVTGNEQSAIDFLNEIGIKLKDDDNEFRKLVNLTDEEMKKLITAIILRRIGSEENPDDILGKIYSLIEENEESPMKDAKEFSTLLNACARLGKSSIGIGACLGDHRLKERALEILNEYNKEVAKALNWFYNSRNSGNIIESSGYVIVNAEDNVRDTMIGTLISMLSKSNVYNEGTVILGLAHSLDARETKVSIRVCAENIFGLDLGEIILEISGIIGARGGGHRDAAGAVIPVEKEMEFINNAKLILEKNCVKAVA